MRSLLTEGRIKYKTVVCGSEGPEPKTIEREGPTNLLVTTTAIHLDSELETKMLSIPIDDSREQTSAVIRAQASSSTPEICHAWNLICLSGIAFKSGSKTAIAMS